MSFEVSEEDVEVDESDDDCNREKDMINGKSVHFSLVDVVKKGQHFTTKNALKATMKICAMKHNFDYKVGKSDKTVWHAIKAAFSVGKQALTLIDDMYTTASWRSVYEETINPISVPEDSWIVPSHVKQAKVLPPESRKGASTRKKRRYEKVEDKIRSSQGTQCSKRRKCSRCGIVGHNRSTCDRAI
ncbi:hypothetical protein F2Q70_00042975 [Brassica cretica]|uniref:Uncharacterized protein n=1 Tax=Brassica cretica TaxID=69181 RepID=A0A8S9KF44_BRACR|nr:hypothetical protein F2Q70_00042975 [Brassica cretica]